jgi:hypothetical protein
VKDISPNATNAKHIKFGHNHHGGHDGMLVSEPNESEEELIEEEICQSQNESPLINA